MRPRNYHEGSSLHAELRTRWALPEYFETLSRRQRFWIVVSLIAFIQAILLSTIWIGELTCDQRPVQHLSASLLAGIVATLLFAGATDVRFGRKFMLIRAAGGFAVFMVVFLMAQSRSGPCVSAATTGLNVSIAGHVEWDGQPVGVVNVHFDAMTSAIITRPDGSFAISDLSVGPTLTGHVSSGNATIPFSVPRPYGVRTLFLVIDLATGKATLGGNGV